MMHLIDKRVFASAVLLVFTLLLSMTSVADSPVSGDWTERQKRLLASLSLTSLGKLPSDKSNSVADSTIAIAFGRDLFFEKRLSKNSDKSCATCHQPNNYFTDKNEKLNNRKTLRVAPTLIGSAYQRWFYWDGRRDSLWAQALLPIETPNEMGGSRVAALRLIDNDSTYRKFYQQLFPQHLPALSLAQTLPHTANPYGSHSERRLWAKIPRKKKHVINQGFANIGKAIAAFERTLLPQPGRIDRYLDAVSQGQKVTPQNKLTAGELKGLALFINPEKTQCMECHNGPLFSNKGFHNIGTGKFSGDNRDYGRIYGKIAVQMDPFNCFGRYSDAQREDCYALRFLKKDLHSGIAGQFKSPTLRGVSKTAPYFHDGSKASLRDVILHYHNIAASQNTATEVRVMPLSQEEIDHLVLFLKLL